MEADVGHEAWMDQVGAEFRDMARMAGTYFAHLRAFGLPDSLIHTLVSDWHSLVWEQSGTFDAEE